VFYGPYGPVFYGPYGPVFYGPYGPMYMGYLPYALCSGNCPDAQPLIPPAPSFLRVLTADTLPENRLRGQGTACF